jgi:hypothetical protein
MKKFFIAFTIILLFSSVFAVAEDYSNVRSGVKDALDDANKRLQDGTDTARKLIDSGKVVGRKVTDKVMTARARVDDAKEAYATIRERYSIKRAEISQVRDRYKNCINSDTAECVRVVKQAKGDAKEHLINSAELILKHLEELKTRIEASTDLSEEDVNDLIAKLDEQIANVQEAKSTLENINEDSTREEIKEAANTIRNAWDNAKIHVYKARLRYVGAKLNTWIGKAEIWGARAEEKASEINSDDINSLIEDYNSKVQSAKESYEMAENKWQESTTNDRLPSLIRETNQYMKEANNYLKEARRILSEIIKQVRQNNQDISLDIEEVEE